MCGIFGIVNDPDRKASQTVLAGLQKLEYRGYDSWGIALIPDDRNTIAVDKHIGKIGTAQTTLPAGQVAIGHTRWATHGGVTDVNAHPHLDCTKHIAVLHNGIVENYQALKTRLKEKGHVFVSETDTEVIAHLVEEKQKSMSVREAVFATFKELVGSNAIGVLDLPTGTVTLCRNGSPLVLGYGSTSSYFASDVTAFLDKTNKVVFLEDGQGAVLEKEGITVFDVATGKKINPSIQILDWKREDAEKGGFPHFLLKEIYEEKTTIPKTASLNEDVLGTLGARIQKGAPVVFIGCGSAYHCGLAGTYFFARQNVSTRVYGAYEYEPFTRFITPETVIVAISQSGETADTLIAAREAKRRGAHLVALVNARGSSLERIADSVLTVGAGPEIAVVSTKAFTAQLAILYLLAGASGGRLPEARADIAKLGTLLDAWLNKQYMEHVLAVAKEVVDEEHMYVIGKYEQFPAGLEFALKIKETSYLHAEAFASGELKHGVLALIQKGTPCFVLTGPDGTARTEILSSASQMKARGGRIIGIGPVSSPEFDLHLPTPPSNESMSVLTNIMVGQILGYYLGIGRGADPDKPRNLAKSVTVK